MDSSEADLGRVEAQSLTNVSHDQRRGTYFPMTLINRGANPLGSQGISQSEGDSVTPPTGDIESVPEFPTSLRLSDLFALPGEDVQMTPDIFTGISDGKKECLEKLRSNGTSMARLKSNRGDSVLHLAAMWGHLELVKEIVSECPCLLLEPNSEGRIPLHVAAHGGHTDVIENLIATFASARQCNEESERLNPYVLKDEDGNTALHLAIEGRYSEMAACLVNANENASFLGNNKGISSLYMAVEAGDLSLVKAILKTIGNKDIGGKKSHLDSKLQGRKYLAHAALKAKRIDILNLILDEYPTLMNEQDSEGRTCLSYGISIGSWDGVVRLLSQSTETVYVCDADGSFPIHTAAEREELKTVDKIIDLCPDSKYLLNRLGQNILHIAAKNSRDWITGFLLKYKDMENLVVGQDVDGNTPLHLAVINWHHQPIQILATSSSKILNIRNKRGLTARDIAELELKPEYIFKERWTLALLLHITHAKRSEGYESVTSLTRQSDPPKNNKDYVNTLLLVAALVATVTFAAGFTIPGGFNSDNENPDLGRAILAENPTLFIFLLFDTLAMQSSVATICTLIWAQLGDPELIRSSLKVALPLLLFALLCMPMAFLFGVITAVGHVKWLLVIICIISVLFFCWAIFILGPHVMLQGSHVPPKYAGDFLVTFMGIKEIIEIIVYVIRFYSCGYTKPKYL